MTLTPRVPMRLVFESHATSLDNEVGLASGWFDVALSATGEEQARTLGDRSLPIVRDARLRECDYGDLTRHPTSEIEQRRLLHLVDPFPNGESYQQVVDRVSEWLREALPCSDAGTLLCIGHRATHYALQHLLNRVTLQEAMALPWTWQPGWTYRLRSSSIRDGGSTSGFTTDCQTPEEGSRRLPFYSGEGS